MVLSCRFRRCSDYRIVRPREPQVKKMEFFFTRVELIYKFLDESNGRRLKKPFDQNLIY